jgi:hypothetical protein
MRLSSPPTARKFKTAGDGKLAKVLLLHLDGGSVSGEELATCKECYEQIVFDDV